MVLALYFLIALPTLIAAMLIFFMPVPRHWRAVYLAVLIVAALAAFWSSFFFTPHASDLAVVKGWPVPSNIAMRSPSDSKMRLVSGLFVIAYPMNFFWFMLLPSLVAMGKVWVDRVVARRQKKS